MVEHQAHSHKHRKGYSPSCAGRVIRYLQWRVLGTYNHALMTTTPASTVPEFSSVVQASDDAAVTCEQQAVARAARRICMTQCARPVGQNRAVRRPSRRYVHMHTPQSQSRLLLRRVPGDLQRCSEDYTAAAHLTSDSVREVRPG